jgi:hypothetical protein
MEPEPDGQRFLSGVSSRRCLESIMGWYITLQCAGR